MIEVVRRVAAEIFIPFSVGGGIRTLEDMREVLLAGAEKVSVNSAAVQNPGDHRQGARAFGSQCIVLGMDVKKVAASETIPRATRWSSTGAAPPWASTPSGGRRKRSGSEPGRSASTPSTPTAPRHGYELTLTRMISEAVPIPVIASGGAGTPEHLLDVLTEGRADAALIASMVHYGTYTIPGDQGISCRSEGFPVTAAWKTGRPHLDPGNHT